jgi:hypothetical protein
MGVCEQPMSLFLLNSHDVKWRSLPTYLGYHNRRFATSTFGLRPGDRAERSRPAARQHRQKTAAVRNPTPGQRVDLIDIQRPS